MKPTTAFLLLALLSLFACSTSDSQQTIQTAKFQDKLITAMRDKDLPYLSAAFAPEAFFQFVVMQDQFTDADYVQLQKNQGNLYRLLFDDAYVATRTGYKASFRTAFIDGGHLSVSPPSSQDGHIASITAANANALYDLFLNCIAPLQCEIVGLNVSGGSGLGNLVFSTSPQQPLEYRRLSTNSAVAANRLALSSGVPYLRLQNPGKILAYGPNRTFQVPYAGNENGYGGVAYALTDRGFLLFRHLTGISIDIMNAFRKHSTLPNGTFVGENSQKIGIHKNEESAKLTVEGRTIAGALMSQDQLLSVLQGR